MMEDEIGKSSTSKSDVEEEEELRLVPRIRLEVSMVKVGDSGGITPLAGFEFGSRSRSRCGYKFSASGCEYAIEDFSSKVPRLYDNPAVKLPRSDIHIRNVVPARYDPYYDEHDPFSEPRSEIGRGSLFFRDLNFVFGDVVDYKFHEKLSKARRFLLDKLRPVTLSYPTRETEFQFWAFEPVSEDPNLMISLLAHQARELKQPQTFIVKGLPCSWFAQPGSSQPSDHLLRLFFQKFGQLRNLYTSVEDRKATCCNVSLLYENYEGCCNALEKLCSLSLQKKGDSTMIADYEVAWKDCKPFERVNFPFDEEMVLPYLLALQRRKLELKKELKVVKKKLDAIEAYKEAYKDSCSKSSKKRKKGSPYDSRKRKASPYCSSKTRRDSSYRLEKRGSFSYYQHHRRSRDREDRHQRSRDSHR